MADNKESAKIVLGPVIGKVTENSARILLELDSDAEVIAVLESAAHSARFPLRINQKTPGVFRCAGLRPATTYTLRFEGVVNADARIGRVKTFDPNATDFCVLAAACDKPAHRKVDLWTKLWETYGVNNKADLIVRHGDQVYADEAFDQGKRILRRKDITEQEKDALILEAYKQVYRAVWNSPIVAKVISHISQLMLWDDHEVRNDWGTLGSDRNPNSIPYRIATMARLAYWQYQRQLWDDILENPDVHDGLEGHMHVWGRFGVMFVDTRGPRSFGNDTRGKGHYIGDAQFQKIRAALGKDGLFGNVDCLLAVHSMPAIYFSTGVSSCLQCVPCLTDKVGFGLDPEEQGHYLHLLDTWKGHDGKKDCVIVAGDLHYAIHTVIQNAKKETVLRQVITSAIGNKPPPGIMTCWLNWCCMWNCCHNTGADYTFHHTQKWFDFNFAELQLKYGGPNGRSTIKERIITQHSK